MYRSRAENIGWQVVMVIMRSVGVAPGSSGTGAMTSTSVGATICVDVTR